MVNSEIYPKRRWNGPGHFVMDGFDVVEGEEMDIAMMEHYIESQGFDPQATIPFIVAEYPHTIDDDDQVVCFDDIKPSNPVPDEDEVSDIAEDSMTVQSMITVSEQYIEELKDDNENKQRTINELEEKLSKLDTSGKVKETVAEAFEDYVHNDVYRHGIENKSKLVRNLKAKLKRRDEKILNEKTAHNDLKRTVKEKYTHNSALDRRDAKFRVLQKKFDEVGRENAILRGSNKALEKEIERRDEVKKIARGKKSPTKKNMKSPLRKNPSQKSPKK